VAIAGPAPVDGHLHARPLPPLAPPARDCGTRGLPSARCCA